MDLIARSVSFRASRYRTALFDRGADVNIRNQGGVIPFHKALKENHLEVVRLFLARGTDLGILNEERETPFAVASGDGQVDTSCYLIEQSTSVHASDDKGWTALHLASRYGHFNAVRLLLDHGADPNS